MRSCGRGGRVFFTERNAPATESPIRAFQLIVIIISNYPARTLDLYIREFAWTSL